MNSKQTTYPWIRIIVGLVLALAVLLAAFSTPAAAQTSDCAKKHTVVAGETLSSIAVLYDVDYLSIAKANSLNDPYPVFVGQILCIPGTTTTTSSSTGTTTTTSSNKPSKEIVYQTSVLRIATEKYPKNAIYTVKVASATRFSAELEWYYVGVLHLNKNGTANKVFRLPSSLHHARDLVVCLKNVRTNEIECSLIEVFTYPNFDGPAIQPTTSASGT